MSVRAGGEYLAIHAAGRLLGLPIDGVRDVMKGQTLRPAPLAPPAVAGLINLRGRVVTVIDTPAALGQPPTEDPKAATLVVIDVEGERYGLLADAAGEVVRPAGADFVRQPASLDAAWPDLCDAFYQLDAGLLHVLNLGGLLQAAGRADGVVRLDPPPKPARPATEANAGAAVARRGAI